MEDYEEATEHIRELVLEALLYIQEACRRTCARASCENIEDYIAAAMDEAEEAARNPSPWIHTPSLQLAARHIEKEAVVLDEKGCREEAELFREAARRLYMADIVSSRRVNT